MKYVELFRATARVFAVCGLLAATSFNPFRGFGAPASVPPPGIAIAPVDRLELEAGVAALGREITALETALKDRPTLLALLPDVRIYHKAVQWPLIYNEFLRSNEVGIARTLLKQGLERAAQLRDGHAPWSAATGLIARGYISKIDGSVQPYGLVVPPSFRVNSPHAYRLDIWLHGRDNNLTELKFIDGRQKSPGEFTPPDTIVLHLYGRYCNANKFAGETDLFEALDQVRRQYAIDENRIAVRGFSMGGAACWHLAVHHAGLWAAAAPGAGFAETAEYLRIAPNPESPPWWEQKLWHLYNATDYALNLFNCPVVAYSGELDKQKQTADLMAKVMAGDGLELAHIIGPQTEHRYHPEAKREVARRLDQLVAVGHNPAPRTVRFTTWTLRYNQMLWVTVDSLGRHWERARVNAHILDAHTVAVQTENVAAFTLAMPPGLCPLDNSRRPNVRIDGVEVEAAAVLSDRSWNVHFRKINSRWMAVDSVRTAGLQKRHGLQGPIDDAFFDRFLFVAPTGRSLNEKVGAWVEAALKQAQSDWRTQFRGDVRIKNDADVSDAEIASSHLILWGDPGSNRLLERILDRLPLRWDAQKIVFGGHGYSSARYMPVLIYPNPLNPERYVVLNSGFTFHHPKSSSNADQTPKLPDYAIVDLEAPRTVAVAGGVVRAGFFDESWKLTDALDGSP